MEKDPEIKAMEAAIGYMESSDESARQRFIFHLIHRYFPEGRFEPKRFDAPVIIPRDSLYPGALHRKGNKWEQSLG